MMRIKRVAFVGTSILLLVCFGLYLFLDEMFTEGFRSRTMERSSVPTVRHYTTGEPQKSKHERLRLFPKPKIPAPEFYIEEKCASLVPNPSVDIQMAKVYDQLTFDNPDGGAWKQGWEVQYSESSFTPSNKLRVFVVPHSHNDPGWKRTFENYYQSQTRSILKNMVEKLLKDERRKFIWAEISFFSLWWSEISEKVKENVANLLERGQLEIVTGGWVMTDEANSHYYSIIEQLIHGHQWLKNNLDYYPKSSWSIDPFGLSPTLPFLLKNAGFQSLLVQRSHYSVKKYLAQQRQLEFRWRQLWDGSGTTELLTHMMPFYSYDVPHTCGPAPKICCQFDFKRLPGYGFSCPWGVPPRVITKENVATRAAMLLDQYKKKATLYTTNVLLVPLGDDFRYDTAAEWDAQYENYQRLFDYINQNASLNTEAQFGTLSDYFNALQEEKGVEEFPSLTGDFFTYADRDNDYWSGYYTSRPFYKRMDRLLMSAMRSSEIIFALATRKNKSVAAWKYLWETLSVARGSHSLFQHHDGVTGTAKDHVVRDYAKKMTEAIKTAHHVIQQSAYFLLSESKEMEGNGEEVFFTVDLDASLSPPATEQIILTFPSGIQERHITFFNSLTFHVTRVVNLKVDSKTVIVKDNRGQKLIHQISPVCTLMQQYTPNSCFLLSFIVEIPPLSLVTYTVEPSFDSASNDVKIKLFDTSMHFEFNDWPNKEIVPREDFSIHTSVLTAIFSKKGFLKGVRLPDGGSVTVNLSFVKYTPNDSRGSSGAYLFHPTGPAEPLANESFFVYILEGPIQSQVYVYMNDVRHVLTLRNCSGEDGIHIENFVNLASMSHNIEIAMRISTSINSENTFFTDLNGIQMIRRKYLKKIPIQGNFYPMAGAVYIEDDNFRTTILTAQPLGVSSTSSGQIDIMHDRRLFHDDFRGLDQGVLDNRETSSSFRLLVEPISRHCRRDPKSPWGALSEKSTRAYELLLHQPISLFWQGDPRANPPSASTYHVESLPFNRQLVIAHVLRDLSTGLVFRGAVIDKCFPLTSQLSDAFNISSILGEKVEKIYQSSLTFNKLYNSQHPTSMELCDNQIKSFYLPN